MNVGQKQGKKEEKEGSPFIAMQKRRKGVEFKSNQCVNQYNTLYINESICTGTGLLIVVVAARLHFPFAICIKRCAQLLGYKCPIKCVFLQRGRTFGGKQPADSAN